MVNPSGRLVWYVICGRNWSSSDVRSFHISVVQGTPVVPLRELISGDGPSQGTESGSPRRSLGTFKG